MNKDIEKKKMTFRMECSPIGAKISIEQHIVLDDVFKLIMGETDFNFYESTLDHDQIYRSHSIKCSNKMGKVLFEIIKKVSYTLTNGETEVHEFQYNPN